jgi:DNA-binding FadR family transcriptional regulator
VDGDVKFHEVIFEITNNQRLISIAHNLREQVYRYRVEYVKDFSYHDVLVEEHYEITNAILTNDVKTAKEIMRKHLYNQELIVIKNLKDSLEE